MFHVPAWVVLGGVGWVGRLTWWVLVKVWGLGSVGLVTTEGGVLRVWCKAGWGFGWDLGRVLGVWEGKNKSIGYPLASFVLFSCGFGWFGLVIGGAGSPVLEGLYSVLLMLDGWR